MAAGRVHQVDDIAFDFRGDVDLAHGLLGGQEVLNADDLLDQIHRVLELLRFQHRDFLLRGGIAQFNPDQEAVELRFG
jgi:hypothetical protein